MHRILARLHMTRWRFAPALAALLACGAAPANAKDFPTRPVTISIGYSAGGTVDIAARIIADDLTKRLGQRFLVDNRPGASGMVSADYVARAKPDGYTLGMITTSQLGTNPHLYSKIAYKAADFSPIGIAVKAPIALAVANAVPAKTIAEFQSYARQHGATMTYGSFGLGTNAQLVTEVMSDSLGIKMQHAPYVQGAMARTDLASGTIQALVDSVATLTPLHNGGQIRVIGNFDETRSATLPDVPTFKEAGFPDLVAYTWIGLLAPAGVPEATVETLSSALKASLAEPAVKKRLEDAGFVVTWSSPAAMAAEITRDFNRWGPVVKRLGIKLD
ncbi:Bug family tripartite tricarboxylate transporter substrate binding protein [Chelatococcus asaccharovorans]|uniref:Bug family tripartite tricarboxylate transporter substrate binding protein n=1 Tax=Chelatococcus asaccharovorans TaxID=28210 RepID=UPI00224C6B3A|nr:tripartite tricarboxylate transporter substrate binding protein [Chelatococcus asaccharovorans]CAH1669452.1 Tripartite-type tricarboxylate transporter receptor subunit TctC [Chelatococcus asaccharovorans]CAH1679122.1 Tripartite-type tricarboxylate transporter receptor subunit TctC [Chelatococcus asaccharovorans]